MPDQESDGSDAATLTVVDAPEIPATRVRFLVLFAVCTLAVVTYVHRVGFATASSPLREELGLDQSHLGWLMASFMIAYGLAEVPFGIFGDRFGARHLLAIVILGGSLTTAGIALVVLLPPVLSWRIGFLVLLRFLFGTFQAGTFPSVSRILTDWIPTTERGSAQGFLWMSSRIGGTIAPLLLVPLFAWFGNWRTPLVIVAGLGVLWCAAFWPWFRNRPEEMSEVNAGELRRIESGRARRPAKHGATPWKRMRNSGSVWALCLMYGALGYSGNFFITLLNDYLKVHRGLDGDTVKWLTALPFACGVGACLLGGVMSDLIIRRSGGRLQGRRIVGALGMSLAGASILATIWVRSTPLLGLLLCVTFLGNDLAMGPAWAAAADIGESHAGTLGGLMNMISSFSAALAAIITGNLFHAGIVVLPFVLFALAYLVGVFCWLRVDVTRTLADPA
jgi:ACS family glucarate transporter-like MFS transporter